MPSSTVAPEPVPVDTAKYKLTEEKIAELREAFGLFDKASARRATRSAPRSAKRTAQKRARRKAHGAKSVQKAHGAKRTAQKRAKCKAHGAKPNFSRHSASAPAALAHA